METEIQRTRAERFREMHQGPHILVLPNAWDAGSARIFEQAGFPAVATTSAGIASSFGLPDGQRLPREDMLEAVRRIAHAVSAPVTADMEAGYHETPEGVAETARLALAAGAIGMNLEDSTNLERLGAKRVSVGSGPSRACLALVMRIAKELREKGTYTLFTENTLSYADVNRMFA